MKKHSFMAIVSSAAILVLLSGCGDGGSPTSSSSSVSSTSSVSHPQPTGVSKACKGKSGTFTLGVVSIDEQTAFFSQMNTGIEDVAKKAGAKINFVSGKDDASTQVTGIENLISAKVDALVVDPYDQNALVPAFTKAKASGIPVVSVDGMVTDSNSYDTQVGTSNEEGGSDLAKSMLKLSGGKGEVGIVGALNSTIQITRQEGFEKTVKEGGMTVKSVVDGKNQADSAQTAAENLLTANPSLKYIYATGEPALNGAIAAAKSQGRTDISIVGWDLSQTSADALKSGIAKAVIQQNTFGFGNEAAKAAINLACGTKSVDKSISVPITIVTKQNLSKYSYYLKEA